MKRLPFPLRQVGCRALRVAGAGVLLGLLIGLPGHAAPAVQSVPEYKLKAAFVYNFVMFTEWPAGDMGGAVTLCLNIDSPLRPALEEFYGKPVKGLRLVVRALANLDNARGCQVLYVDSLDHERWPQVRKNIGAAAVLTISDDPETGRAGTVITLGLSNERVVFDVDMSAARQAGLTLSSKLLRLARSVR